MFRFYIWGICLLFIFITQVGCATYSVPPDKELAKNPDTVYNFFRESIKCKEYGNAYNVLSPNTKQLIQYDEFYIAFNNFFALKRIITDANVTDINVNNDAGKVTITNNDFDISRDFRIDHRTTKRGSSYWVIDLSREEIDDLVTLARKWYNYQLATLGERKYSIPAWWRFKKYKL